MEDESEDLVLVGEDMVISSNTSESRFSLARADDDSDSARYPILPESSHGRNLTVIQLRNK